MSERSSGGDLRDGVVEVTLTINGRACKLAAEPRMTLLDALREELVLTGTKKGCDRGECGACTVHIEGRRALSCMTLAAMQDGKRITTIEGLERDDMLHPLQAAFIEHDGFQCGFLYIRANHVRRCYDRGGESGLAQRRDGGRREAVHPLGSVERGDPRADERQSLPVCLLSQHCGCDRQRSGEELNHAPLCAFENR